MEFFKSRYLQALFSLIAIEVAGALTIIKSWNDADSLKYAIGIQLMGPFSGLLRVLHRGDQNFPVVLMTSVLLFLATIAFPLYLFLKGGKKRYLIVACAIWYTWGIIGWATDRY